MVKDIKNGGVYLDGFEVKSGFRWPWQQKSLSRVITVLEVRTPQTSDDKNVKYRFVSTCGLRGTGCMTEAHAAASLISA